jgi:hypothetical protein
MSPGTLFSIFTDPVLTLLAALHAADASGARLEVMRTLTLTHLIP